MTYHEFLESKMVIAPESGVEIDPGEVNPALKPHQRDAVVWALRGGKRALFESFGLGKTVQELEFCRLAVAHESGYALIVLPLGVRQEFARDAVRLLGWPSAPAYVRTMEEARQVMRRVEAQETAEDGCTAGACRVMMTNYERVRDGDMDPEAFTATSLDEASVLRSFGSKTYQTFLDKFRGVRYKLVSTATPSPNRYKELIHYAGYLDVMDTGQALTRSGMCRRCLTYWRRNENENLHCGENHGGQGLSGKVCSSGSRAVGAGIHGYQSGGFAGRDAARGLYADLLCHGGHCGRSGISAGLAGKPGGKIGDGAVPVHQKAHRVFAGRLRDSNCTWKHWGTECKFAGWGRKENTWERKRKLTGATVHGTRSQGACVVVNTAMRGGLRRDLAAIHQTKNCTSLTCGRW